MLTLRFITLKNLLNLADLSRDVSRVCLALVHTSALTNIIWWELLPLPSTIAVSSIVFHAH